MSRAAPVPSATALTQAESQLLDGLRGLRWQARSRPSRGQAGAHRSRSLAPSAELAAHRLWQPGDDIGRIDWKLLARSDRAYIRQAPDQVRLATLLIADASLRMAWPLPDHAKWRQAARLALGLGAAVRAAGDPLGLTIAGPARAVFAPEARTATLSRLATALRSHIPGSEAELAPLLAQARAQRVVILSDFLGPVADSTALLAAIAAHVARGAELHLVQILDPAELDPPARLRLVCDPQSPDRRRSLEGAARADYLRAFDQWRGQLGHEVRKRGAFWHFVTSDTASDLAVRRIITDGGR